MNEKSTERYYEILELKAGASQEEIKDAYRDLAKVWHPDRFSHDSKLQNKAEEKLRLLNEAYEKLRSINSEPDNSSDEAETSKTSHIITIYQEKWSGAKRKTAPPKEQNKQKSQTKSERKNQADNQTKTQKYDRTQKKSLPFAAAKKTKSKSALSPSLLGFIIFGIFIVIVLRNPSSFPGNLIPGQSTINQTENDANKNLNSKSGAIAESKVKESDSPFQYSAKTSPNSTKSNGGGKVPVYRNTTDQTLRNQMLGIQNSITKGTNKYHNKVAVGSTKDEVLGAYGYPDISSKNEFHYNNRVIYFDNDKVSGVKQNSQESRIILRTQ